VTKHVFLGIAGYSWYLRRSSGVSLETITFGSPESGRRPDTGSGIGTITRRWLSARAARMLQPYDCNGHV